MIKHHGYNRSRTFFAGSSSKSPSFLSRSTSSCGKRSGKYFSQATTEGAPCTKPR